MRSSRSARGAALRLAFALAAAWVSAVSAEAPTAPPPPASAAAGERPHILLIMAEDLSPRLGAYADPVAKTPNLDRLAEQGVRFDRAFTTAGVCAPSRAAIIMGAHQDRFGAGHMRAARGGYVAVPPADWKAFPETLRAAGYYTINNGKTDYQMSDRFGGSFGGPSTIWDAPSDADWSNAPSGRPFFAYLTLESTHESQVWPTWHWDGLMPLLMTPMRLMNHWHWPLETDPRQVQVPAYYPDTPTVRADLARHYNNIARMDEQVGAWLDRLEAEDRGRKTVVIFTSDHGDGLPRAKRWLYDSGLRVPLIVRWPDRRDAGTVNSELVSLVDLAPTLLALAGVSAPEHYDGRVFLDPGGEIGNSIGRSADQGGVASFQREPEPRYVFAARGRIDESPDQVRAVRDRRFKYVRHAQPGQPYVLDVGFRDAMPMMQEMHAMAAAGELEGAPALWFRARRDAEELFDTEADPFEVNNLVGQPAFEAKHQELAAALDAFWQTATDLGALPEAQLRERFWPGGVQPETAAPEIAQIQLVPGTHAVTIRSATEGASISYRVDGGGEQLYTTPLSLSAGSAIEARAVRYGWLESDWTRAELR